MSRTDRRTHERIDPRWSGEVRRLSDGHAEVELQTREEMAADDEGLVHGGFVFSLADHAAMLAVNHPHVVLAQAETKFLRPVRVGETVVAEARVHGVDARRPTVEVVVRRGDDEVMTGTFGCAVLDRHVLSRR